MEILKRLTDGGNTVVVIEHNLDVIKTADYIIDMGPEGGDRGGMVIATGTPEEVAKVKESYTGYYVGKIMKRDAGRQKEREKNATKAATASGQASKASKKKK